MLAVASVHSPMVRATSCVPEQSSYVVRAGQIWFSTENAESSRFVKGIDIASFRDISPYGGDGPCAGRINDYARDKDHIFYRGIIVAGADPETFVFLDNIYTKDKAAAYSGATRLTSRVEAFHRLPNGLWATDGLNYFYKETKFKGEGFEIIPNGYEYARTSTHVYNRDKALVADAASFEVIAASVGMTKDKNTVYYRDVPVKGADPSTITQVHGYLFKDKRAAYLEGREIVGLNPATARTFPLDGGYTADDSAVFLSYKKIDRDPATFEVLQPWYTKDKHAVYFRDVVLEQADPQTFVSTSMSNAYDKNYRFHENRIVCKLNPAARGPANACGDQ
jgi:hypothetical protein